MAATTPPADEGANKSGKEGGGDGGETDKDPGKEQAAGDGKGGDSGGNGTPFVGSSTPPDPNANSNAITITAAGTDFDFTGAHAVASLSGSGLLQNGGSEYKKLDADGNLVAIDKNGKKVGAIRRVGKTRLLVKDDTDRTVIVQQDGSEVVIADARLENTRTNASGEIYYVNETDRLIYRIPADSTTPVKLTNFPFNSMELRFVSGGAVRYEGRSGPTNTEFTYFKGVNYSFGGCNGGFAATLADVGLLFDDCTGNNYAYWNGTEIAKEHLDMQMNGGGFWHPNGAVVFGQGQPALNDACPFSAMGILFVNADKTMSPIGCAPEGVFGGFSPERDDSSSILLAGDFFVIKGQNNVRVYATNSWQQDLLSGFTPINLSLAGTTLYYDGMTPAGGYVVGKIDIITKETQDFSIDGQVADLIGLQ
jgi:hypothetical protein